MYEPKYPKINFIIVALMIKTFLGYFSKIIRELLYFFNNFLF